jgi:hypothetical protein
MIDPIAIPILIKVLDWIFGEGSKILQERRDRRKKKDAGGEMAENIPLDTTEKSDQGIIKSKDEALNQQLSDELWIDAEPKIKHLLTLLDIYTKNYYLAREELAKWGTALVPQIIVHNLTEAEDNITEVINEMVAILSKVYKKKIFIPGIETND